MRNQRYSNKAKITGKQYKDFQIVIKKIENDTKRGDRSLSSALQKHTSLKAQLKEELERELKR